MGAVWKQLRRKSRFKKLYNINLRGSTEFDCFNLLVSHHHFDDDDGFGPRNRSIQSARGNRSRSGDHIEGVSHFSFPEIVCWHQRLICCKRSRRLIWSLEWASFCLFSFFLQQQIYRKIGGLSGIQNRIGEVECNHDDHLTTTTTALKHCNASLPKGFYPPMYVETVEPFRSWYRQSLSIV